MSSVSPTAERSTPEDRSVAPDSALSDMATPEDQSVAPDSALSDMDTYSENSYKDLANATPEDLAKHPAGEDDYDDDDRAPMGFRFLRGSYFPNFKGHIVPKSVDSSSEYAKRDFDSDGFPVDHPCKPDVQEKKRGVKEVEEHDDEPPAKAAKVVFQTKCGMVMGEGWDGNGQCMCYVCMGDFDSQESEQPHAQEGVAAEA